MRRPMSSTGLFCSVVALLLLLCTTGEAQVSFKIGGGAGLVMPMGDYKGTLAEYYAGSNYGLSTGFGFHAKARVGLLGFNLTGEIGYSFLSNDGAPEAPNSSGEVDHRILSLKVGPEFRLGLPAVPVTPYLGVNVALNSFSGSSKFQSTSNITSSTIDMASASRIGIGATIGLMISSIDVAVHYNLHNLTGKSWIGRDNRVDTYSSLNDDKDPAYAPADDKHVVNEARSIQSLVITVSVMFGI
ncbi:MAG: outer membrane beta-barrel protein [Ignavibacteriales bacterium]|nr:outer membrane beta-barrel protein [Ignavibacteriales bacterium]